MEYETRNMGRGLRVTEHKLAWRTKADRRRDGRFGGRIPGLMDIWFFNGWQEEFLREPRKGCDSQAARLRKEDSESCMTG